MEAVSIVLQLQANIPVQTELPPDYVELEKRVEALKQAHQRMLNVT